jgi:glycosyltransferase involved in cell wall biosynthesis
MSKNILLVENLGADFYKSRLKYAKYLVSQGWQVFVIVPFDEYTELIKGEGITVYSYYSKERQNWLSQIYHILKAYKHIFKENDILIVHSFRLFPNFINVLANLFSSRKAILHVTGMGVAYSNNSFSYLLLRWISNVVYWFMINFSSLVIVQNDDDRKQLQKIGLTRRKVLLVKGSGVDTDLFTFDPVCRQTFRDKYLIRPDEILFICVTRLIWEKGIREMVAAFQESHEDYPQLKLMIVGAPFIDNPRHVSSDYITSVKGNSNIIFTGKHNGIEKLLSAADVFLYPSYYREGIPRSVLEALSIGIPIITTDTPGCNITVQDGLNGYLIKPRSVSAISGALMKIVNNPSQLKVMGVNSRLLAESTFKDSIIYKQMAAVYESDPMIR